jgi:hypothetical protein
MMNKTFAPLLYKAFSTFLSTQKRVEHDRLAKSESWRRINFTLDYQSVSSKILKYLELNVSQMGRSTRTQIDYKTAQPSSG